MDIEKLKGAVQRTVNKTGTTHQSVYDNIDVEWIVISENSIHYNEIDLSWLKRHCFNTSKNNELLIVDVNGENITQLRLDKEDYLYHNVCIMRGDEIYSERALLNNLVYESGNICIAGFNDRYNDWFNKKQDKYVAAIFAIKERGKQAEEAERKRREEILRRRAEAEQLKKKQQEEKSALEEIDKWFNVQTEEYKPKIYNQSPELSVRLRKGQIVYIDGQQWLLCKLCRQTKPAYEFGVAGRTNTLGVCLECLKNNR